MALSAANLKEVQLDLFADVDEQRGLFLRRVSFDVASQAVRDWHYSRQAASSVASYGTWERGAFVGVVCYGPGACPNLAKPFGLGRTEVRELVRVALHEPKAPVSKIVAVSLRLFHREFPDVRALVSFADTNQGHAGTIYQASNWLYLGSKAYHMIRLHGRLVHPRTVGKRYGTGGQSIPWLRANIDPAAERVRTPPKHKYFYPFDDELRRAWLPKSLPYPKRAGSVQVARRPDQDGRGGSIPTPAL